ncbi:MAG: IclR family transcriptional regulator [Alphaproteobacteria bacterium]
MSHAILKHLADEVGEACELGVLAEGEVALIDQVQPDRALVLRFGRGERIPAHCTAIGKMLLGSLPRRRRERLIGNLPLKRYTDNTIIDAAALASEVERARTARVATASNEFLAGVVGVAVPVMGPQRRACAALALVAPEARLTLGQALEQVPRLHEVAGRLSAALFTDRPDTRELGRDAEVDVKRHARA